MGLGVGFVAISKIFAKQGAFGFNWSHSTEYRPQVYRRVNIQNGLGRRISKTLTINDKASRFSIQQGAEVDQSINFKVVTQAVLDYKAVAPH